MCADGLLTICTLFWEVVNSVRYLTIRATAKLGDFPKEAVLRGMVKRGECPGLYQGSRFYVDTVRLREYLDTLSSGQRKEER